MPYAPWTSIFMDFITELPESAGFTQIWVVVDRFTKMAHFIPLAGDTTAEGLARKFLWNIWKLHGLPKSIISDRDAKFTAHFWSSLTAALGIDRKLSTAGHPQTDGQTERVNQSLEQYLRNFCNYDQDDWAELLPMAEYAYNNSTTSATGISPFYANYGFNPQMAWLKQAEVKNPAATLYTHWLKEVHVRVLEQLQETWEAMSKYYNRMRLEPPPFKVGDKVLLQGKNLKTKRPSKKLGHKMEGPFPIVKFIGTHAVKLKLPKTMKCHNVFHISLLEPYRGNALEERRPVRPEPIEVESEEEWQVKRII